MSGSRKRNNPEHRLQMAAVKWLRQALPLGSLVMSIDHAHKSDSIAWNYLTMRGVLAGTPDVVCLIPEWPSLWIELKAEKGQLTQNQIRIAGLIHAAGHHWTEARSLTEIETYLRILGVPLRATTMTSQEIEQRLAARATVKPKPARKKQSNYRMARIAQINALRLKTPF